MAEGAREADVVHWGTGERRTYACGVMSAVFKSDGDETGSRYSVSAHGFENRTAVRAGVQNVFIPGGFERRMPEIVAWYEAQADGA